MINDSAEISSQLDSIEESIEHDRQLKLLAEAQTKKLKLSPHVCSYLALGSLKNSSLNVPFAHLILKQLNSSPIPCRQPTIWILMWSRSHKIFCLSWIKFTSKRVDLNEFFLSPDNKRYSGKIMRRSRSQQRADKAHNDDIAIAPHGISQPKQSLSLVDCCQTKQTFPCARCHVATSNEGRGGRKSFDIGLSWFGARIALEIDDVTRWKFVETLLLLKERQSVFDGTSSVTVGKTWQENFNTLHLD